jgi:hypothetical protein
MMFRKYYWVAIICATMAASCDEWDDHNEISQRELGDNLLQKIKAESDLSIFAEYLETTGYDKVLTASKAFTVWAPDNGALSGLSPDIVNDLDKLTEFIGNHISYQEYFTQTATPSLRVKMLNGKNLLWSGVNLETAGVKSANMITRNGVLHIMNGVVEPKQNSWEIIGSSVGQKHNAYMQSLTYESFVDSLATQIGVNPDTGEPIYEPGTGVVTRNHFMDQIFDIDNEDSLSTFIVLTDDAFTTELDKLTPYFKTITGNQDSTDSLASWHLVKDLVFNGRIQPEDLPDTLVSLYGVKVPVDKSAIVETHFTSNGIVYVMNKVDFQLKHKFPPIIIEGEHPDGFSRDDKGVNIHYRYREWASGNFDLRVFNHGVAQFNVRYKLPALHAMPYKIYWRTVNDFIDTLTTTTSSHVDAFQQKLVVHSVSNFLNGAPAPLKDFGYVKVIRIKTNTEENRLRYLGDYTHANYTRLYLYVVANNVASPNMLNPIELDYIKLVPVF